MSTRPDAGSEMLPAPETFPSESSGQSRCLGIGSPPHPREDGVQDSEQHGLEDTDAAGSARFRQRSTTKGTLPCAQTDDLGHGQALRPATARSVESGVANMRKARVRAHRKGTPMAAIRGFCVECAGGELAEVRNCTSEDCLLFPFRMGKKNAELLATLREGQR